MLRSTGLRRLVCRDAGEQRDRSRWQPDTPELADHVQTGSGAHSPRRCGARGQAGSRCRSTKALGAQSVAISGHKIGGPKGVRRASCWRQGRHRNRRRFIRWRWTGAWAGGAARRIAAGHRRLRGRTASCRQGCHRQCTRCCVNRARSCEAVEVRRQWCVGRGERLPNTTCIALPGVRADTQVIALDLAGIAVSAGAACSSGKVARSHVLDAMGLEALAGCAIRVSLPWNVSTADVEAFADAYVGMAARLSGRARAA